MASSKLPMAAWASTMACREDVGKKPGVVVLVYIKYILDICIIYII
jgi:hypothetical protein